MISEELPLDPRKVGKPPKAPTGRASSAVRGNTPNASPLAISAQKAAAAAAVAGRKSTTASPTRGRSPIVIHSTTDEDNDEDGDDDEEEDDEMEEVAIPGEAGPSSPYSTTPQTGGTAMTGTPGTVGTPGSIDEAYGGYGEGSDEEEGEADDGVIRLEFGGETPEEKAKRIALAMRKCVLSMWHV